MKAGRQHPLHADNILWKGFLRPQTFATHTVLRSTLLQRVLEPGPAPGWGRALLSHMLEQLGLTVPQFPHIT